MQLFHASFIRTILRQMIRYVAKDINKLTVRSTFRSKMNSAPVVVWSMQYAFAESSNMLRSKKQECMWVAINFKPLTLP